MSEVDQELPDELTLEDLLTFAFDEVEEILNAAAIHVRRPAWVGPLVEGPWTSEDIGEETGAGYEFWIPREGSRFTLTWEGTWTYSPTDPFAQRELFRSIGIAYRWLRSYFPQTALTVNVPAAEASLAPFRVASDPVDDIDGRLWRQTLSLEGLRIGVSELQAAGWEIETIASEPFEPVVTISWTTTLEVVGEDAGDAMHSASDMVLRVPVSQDALVQVFERSGEEEGPDDVLDEIVGVSTLLTTSGSDLERIRSIRKLLSFPVWGAPLVEAASAH